MSTVTTTITTTMREEMKIGTKGCHAIADKLLEGVLLHKKMSVECYKVYVACLYYIYEALEEELERNKDNPHVAPIYFPEVFRVPAIESDLEFYYGADWRDKITCLPCVRSYANHLHEVGKGRPHLLAPHAYVRFFGDLSGGQILKKIISRRYSVPLDAPGTAFFDFNHLASPNGFKGVYASRLEELGLSTEQRTEAVKEARIAFEMNIDMLRVLDVLVDTDNASRKLAEEAMVVAESSKKAASAASLRSMAVVGLSLTIFASAAIFRMCPWMSNQVNDVFM